MQIEPLSSDPLADEIESPPVLTPTLVRKLPIAHFVAEWRAFQRRANKEAIYTKDAKGYGAVWVEEYGKRLADEQALAVLNRGVGASQSIKAGRPAFWTRGKLSKVAGVYAAAWAAGSRAPTVAVATHFRIQRSMAAKVVAMARADGLLPRTSQGRSGWELERRPKS